MHDLYFAGLNYYRIVAYNNVRNVKDRNVKKNELHIMIHTKVF